MRQSVTLISACIFIGFADLARAQASTDSSTAILRASASALNKNTSDGHLEARRLAREAMRLAQAEGNRNNLIKALRVQGNSYYNEASRPRNLDSAEAFYRQARAMIGPTTSAGIRGLIELDIGDVMRLRGNATAALPYLTRSLDQLRAGRDSVNEAKALASIARVYETSPDSMTGHYDSALVYYRLAANLERRFGSKRSAIYRLVDIGDVQDERSARSAAADAFRSAIELSRSAGDDGARAYAHRRYAEFLSDHEAYASALAQYRSAMSAAYAAADSEEVLHALLGHADVLQVSGYSDSSILYYRRALPVAVARGDTGRIQAVFSGMGDSYAALDSLTEALGWYSRAISIAPFAADSEGLAVTLGNSADVEWSLGKLDSARVRYETAYLLAQAIHLPGVAARSLTQLAEMYTEKNQLDSALFLLVRADSIAREDALTGTLADIEISFAHLHSLRGQSDSALTYRKRAASDYADAGMFKRAIATLDTIGVAFDRSRRSDSAVVYFTRAAGLLSSVKLGEIDRALLNSVGELYARLNMSDSALAFGERALIAFRNTGDRTKQAEILQFLALRYSSLARYDKAFALEDSALDLARQLKDLRLQESMLNNTGWYLSHLGRQAEAVSRSRQALELSRSRSDTITQIVSLHSIGYALGLVGMQDSLRYYCRKSMELRRIWAGNGTITSRRILAVGLSAFAQVLTRAFPDSALAMQREALTLARDIRDESAEAEALRGIGTALLRRRLEDDIKNATAYFDSAASVLSFVRGRAGEELNRVNLAERSLTLFEEWTLSWLARKNQLGAEAAALGALAASERGRAQALLDLSRGRASMPEPGADMIEEGRSLVRRVSSETSSALIYFVARDSLIIWTIGRSSEIQVHVVPVSRDSLAQWVARYRSSLGVDEASIGPRLVTRGGFGLEQLARTTRGDLEDVSSAKADSNVDNRLAHAILPVEVTRILEGTRQLTIVPQGPLGMVPFAALSLPRNKEKLGDRLSIRYLPSLSFAAQSTIGSSLPSLGQGAVDGALVVGNPTMPTVKRADGRRVRFDPIKAAESEASGVASFLHTSPLLGPRATEKEVKSRIRGARVIHLATHGYAYAAEQRSRDSFVALAPGSGEDGLFTVGEIMDGPRLRATLVVLSACQTGLGNLKLAEGTVGLQRALLAKGAQSVLVSLWSVNDDATSILMSRFYFHWLRGRGTSKSEALRLAQNDLRTTTSYTQPRYWAAFQLVGAP